MVACRDLLARSEIRDMTIFVLHDADIDGYNIARTLGEETARMPDHNIEVIDLGLTVPQAIDHGLETEQFTRKANCPPAWNSTTTRDEWFTGEPIRRRERQDAATTCTRCELNAFSSDELAEFIEAGLARHGVTAKLVPPPDVVAEHVRTVRDEALTEMVWAEIADMVDIDAVVRQTDRRPSRTWPTSMRRASATRSPTTRPSHGGHRRNSSCTSDIDAADGLADALRARLAEQLATPQDHEE